MVRVRGDPPPATPGSLLRQTINGPPLMSQPAPQTDSHPDRNESE